MATVVTLDVFSGRPNPMLQLSDAAETELTKRLGSLSNPTDRRPSGSIGGLGYRGFSIAKHDPTFVTQGHIHVHEAIIDRGVGAANLVDDASIEKFLLDEFRAAIPPAVQDHVLASLSGAEGFLGGIERLKCPPCHAVDAPVYNPGAWNIPAVQPYNNCYNYANDHATNTFAQPGRAHGKQATVMDCAHVEPAAQADGLNPSANFTHPLAKGAGWYVALVIWPGADYHWYRQDHGGCWSHKPGSTAARNVDNAGHAIVDPRSCNRGPYTVFCSYMVTKRGLVIN
jgi:hypothetical protein